MAQEYAGQYMAQASYSLSQQGTGVLKDLSNISVPRSKIGGHQQAVLN